MRKAVYLMMALILAMSAMVAVQPPEKAEAATFTVTNTNDSGAGSLRQAILDANSGDEIVFQASLTGNTIMLSSGELNITDNLTITGLGASNLTIDGNSNSRIFNIADGTVTQIGVTISGLTLTNGYANDGGGGIYNSEHLTLINTTLSGNSAQLYGGGIFNDNNGTATLTGSTLSRNTADYGGGIYNMGTMTLDNSTVTDNTAGSGGNTAAGGGIYNYEGTATLTGSTLSGNKSDYGGGIYNHDGTATLTNSTLSGNTAEYGGGICSTPGGQMTLRNITVSGNTVDYGGGIYNMGTMILNNSTVSGNSAELYGGGIVNEGTVTLTNSTLSGNTAAGSGGNTAAGGGIHNYNGAVTLTNSTVSNNTTELYGGGINNYNAGTVHLTNSTVSGNTADNGGGIFNGQGTVNLSNTIVAANTAVYYGSDCWGGFELSGCNLIGNGDDATLVPTGTCPNKVGTGGLPIDPLIGPLSDNGGPTWTHALLIGSPAINAGSNPLALVTDQRGVGFPRQQGSACDIGAFEFIPPNNPPTDISLNSNSVNENQPTGTVVGNFSTTDPDPDSHTYSLVAGIDDTDNASFSIDSTQLKTAESFDYETKNIYSIRVETDDGNSGTYAEAFTISINDICETQKPGILFSSISADSPTISSSGGQAEITVVIDNSGPTDAVSTDLVVTLPAGLSYINGSSSISCQGGTPIPVGDPDISFLTVTFDDVNDKSRNMCNLIEADGGNDQVILKFWVRADCYITSDINYDLYFYDCIGDNQYSTPQVNRFPQPIRRFLFHLLQQAHR